MRVSVFADADFGAKLGFFRIHADFVESAHHLLAARGD
jgi:hypothetical protein